MPQGAPGGPRKDPYGLQDLDVPAAETRDTQSEHPPMQRPVVSQTVLLGPLRCSAPGQGGLAAGQEAAVPPPGFPSRAVAWFF